MEFHLLASQSPAALLITTLRMVFATNAQLVAAIVKEVIFAQAVILDIGGVTEDKVVTLNATCNCPIG